MASGAAHDGRVDPTARTGGARPAPPPGGLPSGPVTGAGRTATGVALLLVAVVALALAGPWTPVGREAGGADEPQTPPTPTVTPTPDPFRQQLREIPVEPWDLGVLGAVLTALVVLGALAVGVRVLRHVPWRGAPTEPDDGGVVPGTRARAGVEPDLPTLRDGVDAADLELRRPAVLPADAVIAAWVALEEAAARSGVPRHPAATPTEFTVAVLDRTPADPAAVRDLLDLYLRARFGIEPVGPADVERATAAVAVLARGLAADDEDAP